VNEEKVIVNYSSSLVAPRDVNATLVNILLEVVRGVFSGEVGVP